jgi:hypothetical protein
MVRAQTLAEVAVLRCSGRVMPRTAQGQLGHPMLLLVSLLQLGPG